MRKGRRRRDGLELETGVGLTHVRLNTQIHTEMFMGMCTPPVCSHEGQGTHTLLCSVRGEGLKDVSPSSGQHT